MRTHKHRYSSYRTSLRALNDSADPLKKVKCIDMSGEGGEGREGGRGVRRGGIGGRAVPLPSSGTGYL